MKQLAIVDMATLHIKIIVVSVRNINKGKKDMKANELQHAFKLFKVDGEIII